MGITGLFNILNALEDPFDEQGMDDIHLTTFIIELKNNIELLDAESDEYMSYEN